MPRIFMLNCSLIIGISALVVLPVQAQIVELGDNISVDLSNQRRSRTNVRVSGDNGRLNIGVEEQRRPQTRVRISERNGSPSIDVRQERPVPEERVRISLPF